MLVERSVAARGKTQRARECKKANEKIAVCIRQLLLANCKNKHASIHSYYYCYFIAYFSSVASFLSPFCFFLILSSSLPLAFLHCFCLFKSSWFFSISCVCFYFFEDSFIRKKQRKNVNENEMKLIYHVSRELKPKEPMNRITMNCQMKNSFLESFFLTPA